MTDLSPETVGKLVALVRGFADSPGQDRWLIEARAIVADLTAARSHGGM